MPLFFDQNGDVQTSTYDLQDETVARRWAAETADRKPWRPELWALFADLLRGEAASPLRILELGAGPGLLAERVLRDVPVSEYVLFDFSEPMISMARETLGEREDVSFHKGNFKEPNWPSEVPGLFDAVISMQAVHEIRHKRHIPWLYAQAVTLLRPEGILIICDAEPTPEQSEEQRQLASTRREQEHAMRWAGFERVICHRFEHQHYVISARKTRLANRRTLPLSKAESLRRLRIVSTPKAILVGGANGAGKTTFARQYLPLLYPGIAFLNADEIQRKSAPSLSSVAAGKELLRRLRVAEDAVSSFAVETTLASRMYLPHVRRWNNLGFETILHFIEVPSESFAVRRVEERVRLGGHTIPEAAVRRRYHRGLELFLQAYRPLFDLWYHWKTDEEGLKLFASKAAGR